METTKEAMFEAEVYRIAGEIALKSPQLDAARAQSNFEHSLLVARKQQAKSLELRTAMSLARLWPTRENHSKLANCLLRYIAGSRKGSMRAI